MYQAFIFDLDGTLVDSIPSIRQSWQEWCQVTNVDYHAVRKANTGSRAADTITKVAPYLDIEQEVSRLEQIECSKVTQLKEIPGALSFISKLPKECWAVATSGSLLTAQPRLAACQFPEPAALITADQVDNGKPHPESFLRAASAMGVKCSDCLAFEDAPNGVRAALSAGCDVIVIGDRCDDIKHPNIVARVDNFELLKLKKERYWQIEHIEP
ncbi:HAD-IA family hydrolase [Vibrio sp. Of7-15]|uniref:HAD-IA family hydrolase n=1 Tax=Vibrio sp. Of7-15 TaxID=2724879 RepID=UPI001EF38569|nr:HAD-IA family hydrolase [Vibrio sp. Of7-15]MCG7495543.1 HAD-IA family hydrolase [Vibrio sp. Of7-15]